MGDNALLAIIVAVSISSCTACSVADKFVLSNERIALTPQQICVSRAWSQADRIECLKTGDAP